MSLIYETLRIGAESVLLISILASFDQSKNNTVAADVKMDGSALEKKSSLKMEFTLSSKLAPKKVPPGKLET